ncbi:hypothetical protein WJX73_009497 [Symbiochloris irregularis]|uniref:Uncharacterized protein n=1 Tax=Symbiochloris irregularis TaxID=706552 RepID=A0AAW1NYF9_9CHLO
MTALLVAQPAGIPALKHFASYRSPAPFVSTVQSAARPTRVASSACDQLHTDSDVIRYDEYYQGDCVLDQRDLAVRDLSWGELTKIKEFEQEDQASFNEYLKELVSLVPDLGGRLRLVSRRPSILIDKNFEAVPEAHAYLQQYVSPKELNHLVELQPWFLAAHLDEYLAGYSSMLDMGPRDALRGIMMDPGGIGYDFCYGHQAYASRFR